MMAKELQTVALGEVVEEAELSLAQLCRACQLPEERIVELVHEGIIEPVGGEAGRWRFMGVSVLRVRRVQRLQRDLGVNTAGAALALDLLEEMERLRARLRRLEG
jgi:chaperone modulatory protein CbpM